MADATPEMLNATAQIVVALVAANKVPAADVPVLINTVYSALLHVDGAPKALPQQPAVPIKRSIQGDYLVCLEDGAKLKVMARYLKARFDLTPAAYRAKWGLPRDYPMVAPSHSIRLSKLAKHLGLGTALRTTEKPAPEAPYAPLAVEEPIVPTPEPKHTAANVFANFTRGERPAVALSAAGNTGRRRVAQQPMEVGRMQSSKAG